MDTGAWGATVHSVALHSYSGKTGAVGGGWSDGASTKKL